jgi:hypothetical protein
MSIIIIIIIIIIKTLCSVALAQTSISMGTGLHSTFVIIVYDLATHTRVVV